MQQVVGKREGSDGSGNTNYEGTAERIEIEAGRLGEGRLGDEEDIVSEDGGSCESEPSQPPRTHAPEGKEVEDGAGGGLKVNLWNIDPVEGAQ